MTSLESIKCGVFVLNEIMILIVYISDICVYALCIIYRNYMQMIINMHTNVSVCSQPSLYIFRLKDLYTSEQNIS